MSIKVIKAGMQTTIQDLGRTGYQKYGVIVSGGMDRFALRTANLLVGNKEEEAVLEMTIAGPFLHFDQDTLIAICGGDLSPTINGEPIPLWRPVFVRQGSTIEFSGLRNGCRAYLAVAGSFDILEVMGSRSTYLRAEIGGWKGRTLKKEDLIPLGSMSEVSKQIISKLSLHSPNGFFKVAQWGISHGMLPRYTKDPVIRVMKGNEFALFNQESQESLFTESFKISPQSDRMGYRMAEASLMLSEPTEMVSEAVTFGTIQVPPGGSPIILMADHPTTGGYPRIGQVISVDLPIVAQLNPGELVQFQEVSLQEAQELIRIQETEFSLLRQGIKMKVQ